jgi:cell division septation protein DedD
MQKRILIGVYAATALLGGCAFEYQRPTPKRVLAHHPEKPVPVMTGSITPTPTPAVTPTPTPAETPTSTQTPTPATTLTPAPTPMPAMVTAPELSVEEQLKVTWKHLCGLRNVQHVENGRVAETEEQKRYIDEKCAEARWDSHMQ